MQKLSDKEVQAQLQEKSLAPHWTFSENFLHRNFAFADFRKAFAFMSEVAAHADELDHHPDWSNVYNRVVINLHTHDAKGVTAKDFELATRIERSAQKFLKS
jgi:4a-hydroxytetrahydrobiopterin dehydratase